MNDPKHVSAYEDSKGYLWQTKAKALAADCQYRLAAAIGGTPTMSIVQHADKVVEILTEYLAASKQK